MRFLLGTISLSDLNERTTTPYRHKLDINSIFKNYIELTLNNGILRGATAY